MIINVNTTASEIAKLLNESGYTYFGEKAKAWEGGSQSRIYFGKDFMTLKDGELTNRNLRKVRACTIGDEPVEAVAALLNK